MSHYNWTPGPWSCVNSTDIFTGLGAENGAGISAPSYDGWMIADCDMGGLSTGESIANAQLIAAAPDLYEALENARTWVDECGSQAGLQKVLDEIDAALAKARGK